MESVFIQFLIVSQNKILLFNNLNRRGYSFLMKNTVNKIKHFPQLYALGPQILLKQIAPFSSIVNYKH